MDNIYPPGFVDAHKIVTHQDILSAYAESYVKLLFLMGSILFIYVMYNNFVKKPAIIMIKGHDIDIDELAIFPAVFIFLLTGFYYLGWNGV